MANEKITVTLERKDKTKAKADFIIIKVPVNDPMPDSKKGKSLLVASTHGFQKTDILINKKHVILSLNLFIPKKDD